MGFENLVIMVGKVTNISEVRSTRKGNPVVNFKLTIEEKIGGSNLDTEIECMAFNRDAEFISNIQTEGKEYYIKGKLRPNGNSFKLMIDSIQGLRSAS